MKSTKAKVLVVGLTACISLGSSLSLAVSLGEITLNSSLNEPLDASIRLLQLEGFDENDLNISMAAERDFEQAGMDYSVFLEGVDFSIEVIDEENGLIHLSTTEPVTEPSLSFLVDARWPAGRMMREYTVLVNLPTDSEAPAAPVTEAETTSTASDAQPEQDSAAAEETASAGEGMPAPADSRDGEYRVRDSDTLWQIAEENRSADVSVQQAMLAIQRANPEAFIDGNINGLRSGEVLRIPSPNDMLAVAREASVSEVALQNRNFGLIDNQPLAVGSAAGADADADDELRVLTAEDVEAARAENAGLAEEIAGLEMQLMMSEEELDRARLENQELQSRLEEVNSQIDLLDNIIAIEDTRLADLQDELAAQAEVEAEAAAGVEDGQSAVTDVETDAGTASEAQAPAASQPGSTGLWERITALLQNTYVLIGGGVLLIALVVGFLVLRRRRDERYEDDFDIFDDAQDEEASESADNNAPGAAGFAAVAGSGEEDEEDFDPDNLSMDEDDALDPEDGDELPDEQGLGEDNEASRINLAVAYEATGDMEAARNILNSVIEEGDEADQAEARRLLEEWRDK